MDTQVKETLLKAMVLVFSLMPMSREAEILVTSARVKPFAWETYANTLSDTSRTMLVREGMRKEAASLAWMGAGARAMAQFETNSEIINVERAIKACAEAKKCLQ